MNEAAGDWGHTTDGCLFSLTIAIVTSIHRPRFTWPFSLSSPPPSPAPSPVPSPAPPCARPVARAGRPLRRALRAPYTSLPLRTVPNTFELILLFITWSLFLNSYSLKFAIICELASQLKSRVMELQMATDFHRFQYKDQTIHTVESRHFNMNDQTRQIRRIWIQFQTKGPEPQFFSIFFLAGRLKSPWQPEEEAGRNMKMELNVEENPSFILPSVTL